MNSRSVEIGLFFLRIAVGVVFVLHGWSKFEGGISNTVGFFESLGVPGYLASIVAIIELAGGAFVVLGLGTRVFAALFVAVLAGALIMAKAEAPFLGGTELEYVLLASSLALLFTGSRFLALDRLFSRPSGAGRH